MKTKFWLSLGLLVCASSPLAQTPRSALLSMAFGNTRTPTRPMTIGSA